MTPFGRRIRELREERNITQKDMAKSLGLSAAYLSSLENGKRGAPNWAFVQRVISFFNIIWDDAEELQDLAVSSHPKVVIDTRDLSWEATELTNYLARNIRHLGEGDIRQLLHDAKKRVNANK